MTYSYHIFYFPFKWKLNNGKELLFSEQTDLSKINILRDSLWIRQQIPGNYAELKSLYNEKNYYYKFVHNILYDEPGGNSSCMIYHFERDEPRQSDNVRYIIKVNGMEKPYSLHVDAININLYATGIGFMSFYLRNSDRCQSSPDDILRINQYGRRIMPPFFDDIQHRFELSEYIKIEGLWTAKEYKDDFKSYTVDDSWKPASFINELITELADNIMFEPVVDDRMFVASWYKNDKLAEEFTENHDAYIDTANSFSSFWYKYVFADVSSESCQNDDMKKELLATHTYTRWQKYSSLYGLTRYSFVLLTSNGVPDHLLECFQTVYARMVELVLVQRASLLRFSDEVTRVSNLSNQEVGIISERISSLYKEYIRFINIVYFRDVTAQDQGIELYHKLHSFLNMDECIRDLDNEIEELHQYVSLKEDRSRNQKATRLNDIATFFLPVSVITGFWGMNSIEAVTKEQESFKWQCLLIFIGVIASLLVIYNKKKKL